MQERPPHKQFLLRGSVLHRTYGTHKNIPGIYLSILTNNIWFYLLWSPVIVYSRPTPHVLPAEPVQAINVCLVVENLTCSYPGKKVMRGSMVMRLRPCISNMSNIPPVGRWGAAGGAPEDPAGGVSGGPYYSVTRKLSPSALECLPADDETQ